MRAGCLEFLALVLRGFKSGAPELGMMPRFRVPGFLAFFV